MTSVIERPCDRYVMVLSCKASLSLSINLTRLFSCSKFSINLRVHGHARLPLRLGDFESDCLSAVVPGVELADVSLL